MPKCGRAPNPARPEARETNRGRLSKSLDKDLPAESSQFSLTRPTRLDEIKDLHVEIKAGGVEGPSDPQPEATTRLKANQRKESWASVKALGA